MRALKWALVVMAAVLAGCSAGAKRVDCTWRLEPINPPAAEDETGEDAR